MSAYQNVSSDGTTVTLGLNGNPVIQYTTAGIQSGYGDNSIAPAKLTQKLTLGTAQATTSGTSKEWSIPSWAKRVTVNLVGVSTNGTNPLLVQLSANATYETSGYAGAVYDGITIANFTAGFSDNTANAAIIRHGRITLELTDTNTWTATYFYGLSNSNGFRQGGGSKVLAGTLDKVRLYPQGDSFDAGSVNIMYE